MSFQIISGIPLWVWFLAIHFLFLGVKALKTRTVYIPMLFIVPVVFFVLRFKLLLFAELVVGVSYFFCLAVSSFLSFRFFAGQKLEILGEKGMYVRLQGGWGTIVVLSLYFAMRCYLGYMQATDAMVNQGLQVFEMIGTGLFSGYFIGRAALCLNLYFRSKNAFKS